MTASAMLIPRASMVAALAALGFTLVPGGQARAEFYAGGSIGKAAVDAGIDGFGLDESDSAEKLIAGFIFDLPVVDVSIETSYVDFGSPRADGNGAQLDISGLDAFAVAGLDFGIFGVFAKAGMIAWDADASLGGFSASSDGTDSAYGVGMRFNVASLFIRAEYEKFDIAAANDVDMLSAGVIWRF